MPWVYRFSPTTPAEVVLFPRDPWHAPRQTSELSPQKRSEAPVVWIRGHTLWIQRIRWLRNPEMPVGCLQWNRILPGFLRCETDFKETITLVFTEVRNGFPPSGEVAKALGSRLAFLLWAFVFSKWELDPAFVPTERYGSGSKSGNPTKWQRRPFPVKPTKRRFPETTTRPCV